jgi:hypothetical protein
MDEAMDIKAVLEDALKELRTLSTRAELQDGCYETRIDFGTVLQFDSPEWELIFGSLGAGKTILLKAWEEEVHCGVARPKVLPIYVSADRLRGAPGAQVSEPGARAEAHFIAFLKQFAEAVNVAAQKLRKRDRDDGVGSRRLKRQAELIEDLLEAVQRAVREGTVVDMPANATQEEERVEEDEERSKAIGWFRAWWAAVPGFGFGGRGERSRSRGSLARRRLRRSSGLEPDFGEARKRLADLASTLEIQRFCVLLDEWSAVDSRVQPWLAEWLLTCFGAHKRITFKIASDRPDTRLRDEALGIGFRLGRDIENAGALDEPRMSEADLVAFFELLLLKRLGQIRTDLVDHFVGDRLSRPNTEFVDTMFANREAFLTLVRGTEGIPRTFLLAFHKLVDAGIPEGGWTIEEVERTVGPPQEPTELFADELSDAGMAWHFTIRPVAVTTGSRYFLIRAEDREIAGQKLAEMIETELVYRDESGVLPESLRDRFDGYWLSEDGWLSFGRPRLQMQGMFEGAEGPTEGFLNPRDPLIESAKDAERYVLDFTRWR